MPETNHSNETPDVFGRALADFQPLKPAEQQLLDACRLGQRAEICATRPEPGQTKFEVRAAFIRFLALGGDTQATVHEQGVHLQGAWINGSLDLRSCSVDRDLYLDHCAFDAQVLLVQAQVKTLSFQSSALVGLHGDRLQVEGNLFLRSAGERSTCDGEIRLLGAKINGNLDCGGAEWLGSDQGVAFAGDGLQVDGGAFLLSLENHRFTCQGEIRLLGAEIGGDLALHGATLIGAGGGKGDALTCDGMNVDGGVFLCSNGEPFACKGTIRFLAAHIGKMLDCSGAQFIGNQNGKGDALKFEDLRVDGTLVFNSGFNVASCTGRIDLQHASVRVLVDHMKFWPSEIRIDGFTFDALGGDATSEPQARIEWLKKQPARHLTTSFRPQPWTHLIKTLRRMGHKREAAEVGVAYQRQRRAAGRIGPNWHPRRILHWLYELFCGYGYQPLHAVYWLVSLWLFSTLIYGYAADRGAFAPTQATITNNPLYTTCRPDRPLPEIAHRNWYNCPALPASDYQTFTAWAYSLDVILPAVDLQQERLWAPAAPTFTLPPPNNSNFWLPTMVRWLMWFEILFGWAIGVMLLAVLSGLAKPEGTE